MSNCPEDDYNNEQVSRGWTCARAQRIRTPNNRHVIKVLVELLHLIYRGRERGRESGREGGRERGPWDNNNFRININF
jgi:hypothetical protein